MSADLSAALDALATRRIPHAASAHLTDQVDALIATVRRRRTRRRAVQAVAGLAAAAAVAVSGSSLIGSPTPQTQHLASPDAQLPGETDGTSPTVTPSAPVPCAEFPPQRATGATDYEGWWSSTPADSDGNVLTNPADWPSMVRQHPRTIVLDTTTGQVVSAWDRLACQSFTPTAPPTDPAWPANSIVILDADSGLLIESGAKAPGR